jgi:hypothetical protein
MLSSLALLALLPAFAMVQAIPAASEAAPAPLAVLGYVPIKTGDDGRISLPEGAADGFYSQHNSTTFAYHGIAPNQEQIAFVFHSHVTRRSSTDSIHCSTEVQRDTGELTKRQNTCDVSCSSRSTNIDDWNNAVNGFKNLAGNGYSYHGTVAYVIGQAYAFGCDYGKGQSISSSQYNFDLGCVSAQCGQYESGWNSHHSWKSTYGVAISGYSC